MAGRPAVLPAGRSVRDLPLLGRVDVVLTSALEQEGLHIAREKLPCLWIHDVQAVMVDEHGLLFQPQLPAILTRSFENARAHGTGKRRPLKPFLLLATPGARNRGHLASLSVSFITINYRLSTSNLSRHRTRRGRPRRVSPSVICRIPVRHGAVGPEPRAHHLAARWRGQRHRGATGPD